MQPQANIEIRDLSLVPFREVSFSIPLQGLIFFEGATGSGKTRFLRDVLAAESHRRIETLRSIAYHPLHELPLPLPSSHIGTLPLVRYFPALASIKRPKQSLLSYLVQDASTQRSYCPQCGAALLPHSLSDQARAVLTAFKGRRVTFTTHCHFEPPHSLSTCIEDLQKKGFSRAVVGQEIVELERVEEPPLLVHIDTVTCSEEALPRLQDALRLAMEVSPSPLLLFASEGKSIREPLSWETERQCRHCGYVPTIDNADAPAIRTLLESRCSQFSSKNTALALMELVDSVQLGALKVSAALESLSTPQWVVLQFSQALLGSPSGIAIGFDRPTAGLPAAIVSKMAGVIENIANSEHPLFVIDDEPALRSGNFTRIQFSPGFGSCKGCTVRHEAGAHSPHHPSSTLSPDHINADWLVAHSGQTIETQCQEADYPNLLRALKAIVAHEASAMPASLVQEPPRLVELDAPLITEGPYSIAASVLELLDPLREWYALLPSARAGGLPSTSFSFVPRKRGDSGACRTCRGTGRVAREQLCPTCDGTRFRPEMRRVYYKGLSIADILALSVQEALTHLSEVPRLALRLKVLVGCGLGYLALGMASAGLSAGERCRTVLAATIGVQRPPRVLVLNDFFRGCSLEDSARIVTQLLPFLPHGIVLRISP